MRLVQDDQVMQVQVPGGGSWAVTILGHGKLTFGISLFANPDDVDALLRTRSPDQVRVPEVMIGLSFDPKDDLPPATRREIRAAGWEIAGPDAYPQLLVLSTLGGGITRRQMADLTAVIDAVPGFVASHAPLWANDAVSKEPIVWRHDTSGVVIVYQPGSDTSLDSLWELPAALAPAGPEGPGARVGALTADPSWDSGKALVETMLERFANWLKTAGARSLSPAAARRHAVAVEPFLHCLVLYSGVAPQAVTEYDLRDFLYRWYPLKVIDSDTATRSLPGSLKRFFEFLASVEGVHCPWAAAILRDRDTFFERRETRPMGLMSDETVRAWVSDLTADLDARLLLPSADHALGIPWNELMGEAEAALFDQCTVSGSPGATRRYIRGSPIASGPCRFCVSGSASGRTNQIPLPAARHQRARSQENRAECVNDAAAVRSLQIVGESAWSYHGRSKRLGPARGSRVHCLESAA